MNRTPWGHTMPPPEQMMREWQATVGPPLPSLTALSSKHFPVGHSWMVKLPGETLIAAHADFWRQVTGKLPRRDFNGMNPLFPGEGMPIWEIDWHPDDTPAQREFIMRYWRKLFTAICGPQLDP